MSKKAKHLVHSKIDPRDTKYILLDFERMEIDIFDEMEMVMDGESEPDIKVMEKVWEMAINKGLKDSCWAGAGAETSHKASTAPTIVVEKVVLAKATPESARIAARNIVVPIAKRKPNKCLPRGTEVPPTAEARSHPPEIEALLEAERKRASHASARLEIGSTVLNTLEGIILSLKTTENNEYLDAMNACLRGALAHFLRTGTTPVPTSLPPAPLVNIPAAAGLPNHQPPGHQGLQ